MSAYNVMYRWLLETYGYFLTPKEFAELTHHHPAHVRKMLATGEVCGQRLGSRWHIPISFAARFLTGCSDGGGIYD